MRDASNSTRRSLRATRHADVAQNGKHLGPRDGNGHLDSDGVASESNAALWFATLHGTELRYCHGTGAWFVWDGNVWRRDRTDGVFALARELARELADDKPPGVQYLMGKRSFVSSIERFARADRGLAVTAEAWDRDPFLLGTPGGTVDLRTGDLRPSEPRDHITKLTAVEPAERIDCPRWLAFLDEATGSDAEVVRFLQQWLGYCLTGDTREHALLFLYGPGGNGKSVFLNVAAGILNDYAATAAMDTFTSSKSDKHPTDLAMLKGARLVTASETEQGHVWAEARIKQLTGGDVVTARFMRRDFFSYRPAFKLTIVGNHAPVLHNVDDAARRRFNIVPFTVKPATPDPQLEAKLRAEWPGILRWMIEGCLDWQKNGLTRPPSIVEATSDYFEEQDLFGLWLEEKCDVDRGNDYKWTTTAELFSSWSVFAKAAGETPGTAKQFASMMRRHGFLSSRSKFARGWAGIRLKPSVSDRDDG